MRRLICLLWMLGLSVASVRRDHAGDLYAPGPSCVCRGHAAILPGECRCQCAPDRPAFREDLQQCVADLDECPLATFVRPFLTEKIPLVTLPASGHPVHPGAKLSVPQEGCTVARAQLLGPQGWTEAPAAGFRLTGSTLRWAGGDRSPLQHRLMLVWLHCGGQEACAALRVAGTSSDPSPAVSKESSKSHYAIIGLAVGVLGLVYVLAVLVYLKVRQVRPLRDLENPPGLTSTSQGTASGAGKRTVEVPAGRAGGHPMTGPKRFKPSLLVIPEDDYFYPEPARSSEPDPEVARRRPLDPATAFCRLLRDRFIRQIKGHTETLDGRKSRASFFYDSVDFKNTPESAQVTPASFSTLEGQHKPPPSKKPPAPKPPSSQEDSFIIHQHIADKILVNKPPEHSVHTPVETEVKTPEDLPPLQTLSWRKRPESLIMNEAPSTSWPDFQNDKPSSEEYLQLSNQVAKKLSEFKMAPELGLRSEDKTSTFSQKMRELKNTLGRFGSHFEVTRPKVETEPGSDNWMLKKEDRTFTRLVRKMSNSKQEAMRFFRPSKKVESEFIYFKPNREPALLTPTTAGDAGTVSRQDSSISSSEGPPIMPSSLGTSYESSDSFKESSEDSTSGIHEDLSRYSKRRRRQSLDSDSVACSDMTEDSLNVQQSLGPRGRPAKEVDLRHWEHICHSSDSGARTRDSGDSSSDSDTRPRPPRRRHPRKGINGTCKDFIKKSSPSFVTLISVTSPEM